MKKMYRPLLVISLMVFAGFSASAEGRGPVFGLSAGGGGLLGGLFTRYTLTAEGTVDGNPVDLDSAQTMDQFNFGGFLFFDATYAEFSVSLQEGLNNFSEGMSATSGDAFATDSKKESSGKETMLGLSLLGKYPFTLNERFSVFPLLGVEYQFALIERRMETDGAKKEYNRTNGIQESDSSGDAYTLTSFNSWFVDVGGGLDIVLIPNLFLRTELLCGFRLPTLFELDAMKKPEKWMNAKDAKLGGVTVGPSLRLALGYKIK
jgi:hypothetical protein